jgi:hypothetical protein
MTVLHGLEDSSLVHMISKLIYIVILFSKCNINDW